ncbi:hypothetical protein HYH03_016135 [Edaphochlamys debaryana]|uniref:Sulfatase N-terminal domain-containing protein n=1 Tax=Edaphochlamys debaryana TaxID=47281 RepID=A0A835XSD4_9CHLO|nr:hypothetical protein HYH03_016135 [Edaphochlamys debaryana]|eukprot:KAG2485149.1 hypothetical protein HYH03_016135 [Edaphochlamys debaryana]
MSGCRANLDSDGNKQSRRGLKQWMIDFPSAASSPPPRRSPPMGSRQSPPPPPLKESPPPPRRSPPPPLKQSPPPPQRESPPPPLRQSPPPRRSPPPPTQSPPRPTQSPPPPAIKQSPPPPPTKQPPPPRSPRRVRSPPPEQSPPPPPMQPSKQSPPPPLKQSPPPPLKQSPPPPVRQSPPPPNKQSSPPPPKTSSGGGPSSTGGDPSPTFGRVRSRVPRAPYSPFSPRTPTAPNPPPPPPPRKINRPPVDPRSKPKPNFIVIITDDQDDVMNTTHPYYMPALNRHLAQGGTRLPNFLVSTGVCCPARVSAFTGRYAHCTNITGNSYPSGGFRKFYEQRTDREGWMPKWLQGAGYRTALVGKFLNAYFPSTGYMNETTGFVPEGWDTFDATTTGTYDFWATCFALNGGPDTCYNGQYQTDVISAKAAKLIKEMSAQGDPFLLYLAPAAPHVEQQTGRRFGPPSAAARHRNLYANDKISIPKGANWDLENPNIPFGDYDYHQGAEYMMEKDRDLEAHYLARLRALRAVDDMVDAIVAQLAASGQLDNTYVLYTSDNGLHLGQFGLTDGKATSIEEDVRVPFFIRGPGIPGGTELPYQGNLIDIVPTLLSLAGVPIPDVVDGLPLPVSSELTLAHVTGLRDATDAGFGNLLALTPQHYSWMRRDAMILEAWDSDGSARTQDVVFKVLRVCTDFRVFADSASGRGVDTAPGWAARFVPAPGLACYKYTIWCEGSREFYDLSTDPYETRNRIKDVPPRVMDRIDGVLSALIHCRGASCRSPYGLLHPGANVVNFTQTMNSAYDTMYSRLFKFAYRRCKSVYQTSNEPTWTQGIGPQP